MALKYFLIRLHLWISHRKEVFIFAGSIIAASYAIFQFEDSKRVERIKESIAIVKEHRDEQKAEALISDEFSKQVNDYINKNCPNSSIEICKQDPENLSIGHEIFSFL